MQPVVRRALLLIAMLCVPGLVAAQSVDELLAAATPPPGVVFEIVTADETALARVLPQVRVQARRLRERHPALPIAVLTHGSEQFSLLNENAARYAELHALAGRLSNEDGIAVQVCGNHASWRDKSRADFPDNVEVVSSAGEQLARYRAAGYVVIVR